MATLLSIRDVNINLSDIENFLIYPGTGFVKTKVINKCQSLTLMDSNKKTKKKRIFKSIANFLYIVFDILSENR